MTNNETVLCPDCGRPKARSENERASCFKFYYFNDTDTGIEGAKDCASHAKAKAVPAVDVEKEREACDEFYRSVGVPKMGDPMFADTDNTFHRGVRYGWFARAESSKAVPAEGQIDTDELAAPLPADKGAE